MTTDTPSNSPSRLRTGGYIAATLVMLCVAAMSWSGLYGFAQHTLHWSRIPAAMVPISLDVAALTCALLALDTVSKNEPAAMYRTLTAALVGLSAFVNWRYRLASHIVAEEVFFPAMSVLAYMMIDATVRKYRRDIRHHGNARKAPEPLTRYGLMVWLPGIGHPARAWRAASAELAARIPEPAEIDRPRLIVITELSQADAIRHAIEVTDSTDPGLIVAWLAEHGRPVARQRVSDVLRRDGLTSGKHALMSIEGGRSEDTA